MKISVIIPVYNCKKYISECLDSIINQTYKNLQIIIVDDGSTDGSEEICKLWAGKDNRIEVIHQKNKGVSAARNTGMKRMRGDLVSFIDADDTLDLDMYELLVTLMEKYEADISHCGYKHLVGEEVRLVYDTRKILIQKREEALECLVGGKLFVGSLWNKLYKVELLDNLFFDEHIKINEDILFNYQVFCRANRIVFADYAKYNYIAHKNSSACFVTSDLKKISDSCKVNEYIYKHSRETKLFSIAAERYMRSLSGYYRICSQAKNKEERRRIRNRIWEVYCSNSKIGKSMKTTAILLRFFPGIYTNLYRIYDKLRKPNWEV